jgi:hypothetical protein
MLIENGIHEASEFAAHKFFLKKSRLQSLSQNIPVNVVFALYLFYINTGSLHCKKIIL